MARRIRRRFFPSQQQFFESLAPEVLFSGAFGAGKSRILAEKALFYGIKYPGLQTGIFRKTHKSLVPTTLRTFLDITPPEYIKSYNKTDSYIILTNGSEYIFGGMENPQHWGSLNLGMVACDELIEFEEADYNMLLGRLRQKVITSSSGVRRILPIRQAFNATNPGSPSHWLYKRAYVDRMMEVVHGKTGDNIYNPKDYLERVKKFKGRYKERYVEGKWISFEGSVYDIWNPQIHVIPPFKIPQEWRRLRSIDFGYSNPFVMGWFALSPDNKLYLYKELYGTRRLVEDWVTDIENNSRGEEYEATLADWDAEDRATLERYGIPTVQAIKDISPGIQAVYSRLQYDENQEPKFYVFEHARINREDDLLAAVRKPTSTEDEFPGYSWTTAKDGKPLKELPIKIDDHGLDMSRYACVYLESQAPPEGQIVYEKQYVIEDGTAY